MNCYNLLLWQDGDFPHSPLGKGGKGPGRPSLSCPFSLTSEPFFRLITSGNSEAAKRESEISYLFKDPQFEVEWLDHKLALNRLRRVGRNLPLIWTQISWLWAAFAFTFLHHRWWHFRFLLMSVHSREKVPFFLAHTGSIYSQIMRHCLVCQEDQEYFPCLVYKTLKRLALTVLANFSLPNKASLDCKIWLKSRPSGQRGSGYLVDLNGAQVRPKGDTGVNH